jgi:hypothetical protein
VREDERSWSFLLQVEPMTARVIPFQNSCNLHFSFGERRTVAAWCAFRGPAWSVHATQTATGYMVLSIVTPGRTTAGHEPAPAWLVQKMPAGLLLTDAATDSVVGFYPSIPDANDNLSGQCCKVSCATALNRPAADSTGSTRHARSRSVRRSRQN